MGETQRRLHEIDAPPELIDVLEDAAQPFAAGRGSRAGCPTEARSSISIGTR